mgnify:CR=1 FL=1
MEYVYEPGRYNNPDWKDSSSIDLASDRALEVIIQNVKVIEAFRRLESSGIKEIRYLWGNHDAYLKDSRVTSQLGLPPRAPTYRGMHGDLFSEHGHRFDRSNHDNISAWSTGNLGAQAAYNISVLRTAEPAVRAVSAIGHPSEMRDCYLLGATLIYLYQRFDLNINPFSIYVMGHSHDRKLFRFDIRTSYHLYRVP